MIASITIFFLTIFCASLTRKQTENQESRDAKAGSSRFPSELLPPTTTDVAAVDQFTSRNKSNYQRNAEMLKP